MGLISFIIACVVGRVDKAARRAHRAQREAPEKAFPHAAMGPAMHSRLHHLGAMRVCTASSQWRIKAFMSPQPVLWWRALGATCLLSLACLHPGASAQTLATPFAVCEDGQQDMAACRKEVARTQNLKIDAETETPEQLQRNALRRCDAFKGNEAAQTACKDRVLGIDNTVNSGSAMEGGIIRRQTLPATHP